MYFELRKKLGLGGDIPSPLSVPCDSKNGNEILPTPPNRIIGSVSNNTVFDK